jgi:hypothetical protein
MAGPYTAVDDVRPMPAADTVAIASTDNGDDQDIVIYGLDANGAEQSETVTLTGQAKAESTLTFAYGINRLEVASDAASAPAGTIYCGDPDDTWTAGVPGNPAYHVLEDGFNVSSCGIYVVPAGYRLVTTLLHVNGTSAKPASVAPERRLDGSAIWYRCCEYHVSGGYTVELPGEGDLAALTVYRLQAALDAAGSGGRVTAVVHGLLVPA